ncbi:MAG: hypothetical protein ACYS99_22495, partial [Planctomycetota bacterium]
LRLKVVRTEAAVRGRVLDGGGQPAAGLRVEVGHNGTPVLGRFVAWGRHRPSGVDEADWPTASDRRGWMEATTDEDGRFEFTDLVSGVWYQVVAEGEAGQNVRSLRFQASEKEHGVELTVPDPLWLEVEVVDAESGEPVDGAGITLTRESGRRAGARRSDRCPMDEYVTGVRPWWRCGTRSTSGRRRGHLRGASGRALSWSGAT